MANVGTGTSGKVLTATGLTSSSSFQEIGTFSGLTDNGILIGGGAGPFTATAALTNGQLAIGSTGADPVAANITPGTGVLITNGIGSITIGLSGSVVGQTITGSDSVALSPSSGNWNILGLSGSKTSGSGSTLTVKSPPYSDVSASATSVLNTGEFVTGAYTRTLPASAGLADGDLFEYVCTSASALIIQSVGAQKIRMGSALSAAAGTATSTAIGDSISLRFRATDGFFYTTASQGIWTIT